MKKLALFVVLLMIGGSVFAAVQKKQAVQPVAVSKAVVDTSEDLATKKKTELNGTEWNIKLTPMEGKGKAETDVLTFADEKVGTKNLSARGYAPSGYSVRIQSDETVTWETMQISEKDGTVFWRGDVKDGAMHGVMSKRDKKENTVNYSFVSDAK